MIRHCVMFRFDDSVTESDLAAMSAALDALPGQIPEIVAYRHGPDLGIGPANFAYAITADFASVDDGRWAVPSHCHRLKIFGAHDRAEAATSGRIEKSMHDTGKPHQILATWPDHGDSGILISELDTDRVLGLFGLFAPKVAAVFYLYTFVMDPEIDGFFGLSFDD